MGRTRHTRKRHTRRKHKRRRTRRGSGVMHASVLAGGGRLQGGDVFIHRGGAKKSNFTPYMISDFSPGDKRARSAAKHRFEKALKSLKHKKKKSRKKRKSRKHKRKRKSRKHKRRRRKH